MSNSVVTDRHGRTLRDHGEITARQHQLLTAIANDPTVSLRDLALALNCSQSNLYDVAARLLALGYLTRAGCFSIGPRCGQCPHCGAPKFSPSRVRCAPSRKLPQEVRDKIALSVGSATRVARRFGVGDKTVRKIRRAALAGGAQ